MRMNGSWIPGIEATVCHCVVYRHGLTDLKDLMREGLIEAIESLYDTDIGWGPELKLNYSAKDHKGFNHVISTIVRGGRVLPFAEWSIAAPSFKRCLA